MVGGDYSALFGTPHTRHALQQTTDNVLLVFTTNTAHSTCTYSIQARVKDEHDRSKHTYIHCIDHRQMS